MRATKQSDLVEMVELAETLYEKRSQMHEPQDLPGRFGRVIKAIDRVLKAIEAESVLAGGWAVWHHGMPERITRDLDIVIATDKIEDFLQAASVAGFQVLARKPGRWPKLIHKETGVGVDLMPEGARPGRPDRPAPIMIRNPHDLGAEGRRLRYINFVSLIELKVAAGRGKDEVDVMELLKASPEAIPVIRHHLASSHAEILARFDRLAARAQEEQAAGEP